MEQIDVLLDYFKDNLLMQKVTYGYLYTGCRLNELLTITWADIDEINNTVTIKGTKTKSSLRTIPLFEPLKEVLGTRGKDSEKVFNISETTIKRQYSAAFKALNFKGKYTIHSLRHTFALSAMTLESIQR
jgi:Phage integrase family.